MKYTPGTPTTGNLDVTTAQPLDIKHYFADNADLIDIVNNDPLSYYEGMIAQDVDTGQKYRWIESAVGEIPGGYTYGIYVFDSVVYTGRTFNWIPLGSQTVLFEVTDTFPPVENYGQGTTAIRPYVEDGTIVVTNAATGSGNITITFKGVPILVPVLIGDNILVVTGKIQATLDGDVAFDDYVVTDDGVDTVTIAKLTFASTDAEIIFDDTDVTGVTANTSSLLTFTGVYRKTDNVAPGTWTELMTFASIVDVTFIENVVITMFKGTGVEDTIARSDHNHDLVYAPIVHVHPYLPDTTIGLLFVRNLAVGENMDDIEAPGLYGVPIGTQAPVAGGHFPSTTDLNIPAFSAFSGFTIKVWDMDSVNVDIVQSVEDQRGPLCYRKRNGAGVWTAWTRYEATDAAMLTDTDKDSIVTPASLKAHDVVVDKSGLLRNGWIGTFNYKILTPGLVEIAFELDGATGAGSFIAFTAADNIPPAVGFTVSIPCVFDDGTDAYAGNVQIDTSGNVTVGSKLGGVATYDGIFTGHGIYSIY